MKRLLTMAALVGATGCGGFGCVARGARIRTPDGEMPIEDITVGQEVLCVDPDDGSIVAGRISATRRVTRECVRVTVGASELVLTSDHPVYCPDTRSWAPAGDWVLGARTRLLAVQGEGVEPVAVTAVSSFAGMFDVFDLTVDHPLHNFIANGFLVHNKEQIPETCATMDGGTVREFDRCTCANGEPGTVQCSGSQAVCSSCADAGASDGGADAGGLQRVCRRSPPGARGARRRQERTRRTPNSVMSCLAITASRGTYAPAPACRRVPVPVVAAGSHRRRTGARAVHLDSSLHGSSP